MGDAIEPMLTMVVAAGGDGVSDFTLSLVKITATAALVAVVMQRLRLQLIPAYLICGAMLSATGVMRSAESVRDVADLAVVLLLFGIGLHLDVSALKVGLRQMVSAAVLAVLLASLALWPLAITAGLSPAGAAVVAMAGSLSSTAVVLRLMQERRELHRMTGRMSLAILVVQDILVVPMLLLAPVLAKAAGTYAGAATDVEGSGSVWWGSVVSLVGVGGVIAAGLLVMPWLLRMATSQRAGSTEVMTILALAFAMSSAGVTTYIGLGPALGAFLGGFLLSQSAFKYQLSGQIGTLRDVAMAVFFTSVGTQLVLSDDPGFWVVVGVGFAALLVIKAVIIGLSCWASGLSSRLSVVVGMTLAGAGEFGIVIVGVGATERVGLIDEVTLSQWIAIVFLCMLVNPFMLTLGQKLGDRAKLPMMAPWIRSGTLLEPEERGEAPVNAEDRPPRVIVAGFGVVGRAVVDRIERVGAQAVVIEMNVDTVETQQRRGRKVVFGDASDPEVLESAGVREAAALVLAVPDEGAVLRACRVAKGLNPEVYIVARTTYLSRGMRAMSEGANAMVVEEMVTAEAMEQIVERRCLGLINESGQGESDHAASGGSVGSGGPARNDDDQTLGVAGVLERAEP
jgi:CPA2 family monovalent cation:H+ antiporter-2